MKIKYLVLAVLSGILIQSCSEDIETLAPYEEVCLIWSFLDKSDTAHYIIVQKGFTNPNQSAYDIAQRPDSLYFDDIDVTVQETTSSGTQGQSYTLTKVDLSLEGLPKDTGIFSTAENYGYRFDAELNPSSTYTVTVKKGDKEFKAETPIMDVDVNALNINGLPWVDSSRTLNFTPSKTQKLFWSTGGGADIYDGIITIRYFDVYDSAPQDTIPHSVDWRIMNKIPYTDQGIMQVTPSYEDFMYALSSQIPPATAGQKRYIGYMWLTIYAGSPRLTNYLELALTKGGLAAGQVTPEFTEGFLTEDTYGLFDTRGHGQHNYLRVNDSTVYFMRYAEETADLGFVGMVYK